MSKRAMEDLKDMICRELDEIAEKGELSAGDLETVYKLIISKEKLLRIEEIEDDLGYSEAGGWRAAGTYGDGNSYGRHYVRGHYSRRNSYANGRDELRDRMSEMMQDQSLSGEDRNALRRAMDVLR